MGNLEIKGLLFWCLVSSLLAAQAYTVARVGPGKNYAFLNSVELGVVAQFCNPRI